MVHHRNEVNSNDVSAVEAGEVTYEIYEAPDDLQRDKSAQLQDFNEDYDGASPLPAYESPCTEFGTALPVYDQAMISAREYDPHRQEPRNTPICDFRDTSVFERAQAISSRTLDARALPFIPQVQEQYGKATSLNSKQRPFSVITNSLAYYPYPHKGRDGLSYRCPSPEFSVESSVLSSQAAGNIRSKLQSQRATNFSRPSGEKNGSAHNQRDDLRLSGGNLDGYKMITHSLETLFLNGSTEAVLASNEPLPAMPISLHNLVPTSHARPYLGYGNDIDEHKQDCMVRRKPATNLNLNPITQARESSLIPPPGSAPPKKEQTPDKNNSLTVRERCPMSTPLQHLLQRRLTSVSEEATFNTNAAGSTPYRTSCRRCVSDPTRANKETRRTSGAQVDEDDLFDERKDDEAHRITVKLPSTSYSLSHGKQVRDTQKRTGRKKDEEHIMAQQETQDSVNKIQGSTSKHKTQRKALRGKKVRR